MTLLNYIKALFAPIWRLIWPYLRDFGLFVARATGGLATGVRMAWRWLSGVVRGGFSHVSALPSATKTYIALIVFLLCFLLWQLLAYELRQTTFVVVNLVMVTTISLLVFRSMFSNVRKIRQERKAADELREDKARLTEEVRELKDKIRELLSRGNRQQVVESSGQRLYEALFASGAQGVPTGQSVLDALAGLFPLTGGVSFRRGEDGETYSLDGQYALSSSAAEATVSADDPFAGQAIADGKPMRLAGVPGEYLTALSGLGESATLNVYVLPMVVGGEVVSVTEVATFADEDIPQVWEEMENALRKHKAEERP